MEWWNIDFQKDNSDFNFTVNPAGNQNHLMIGQGPAYFEAAEEMSDIENMLAVLDYLHISGKVETFAF